MLDYFCNIISSYQYASQIIIPGEFVITCITYTVIYCLFPIMIIISRLGSPFNIGENI